MIKSLLLKSLLKSLPMIESHLLICSRTSLSTSLLQNYVIASQSQRKVRGRPLYHGGGGGYTTSWGPCSNTVSKLGESKQFRLLKNHQHFSTDLGFFFLKCCTKVHLYYMTPSTILKFGSIVCKNVYGEVNFSTPSMVDYVKKA